MVKKRSEKKGSGSLRAPAREAIRYVPPGVKAPGRKLVRVIATFEVTFNWWVTAEDFKRLDNGDEEIAELVDESEAYERAGTEGTCDMEWDLP